MCNIAARCLEAIAIAKPRLKHALLSTGHCLCLDSAKSPEIPGAACNERAQPHLPELTEMENGL